MAHASLRCCSQVCCAAATGERAHAGRGPDSLTEREVSARLVARAKSNAEIAAELYVSETTIKTARRATS